MVCLRRINNKEVVINDDMIESIEAKPDTIITMYNGNKIVVKESIAEVIEKIVEYRKSINELSEEKVRNILKKTKE